MDEVVTLQRAQGAAHFSWKTSSAATHLDELYQKGCMKVRFPKTFGSPPQGILLNTSGGVTGGDELNVSVNWAAGTSALVSTQAAERIYKSADGCGKITNTLHVEKGANAEWLPQETILFDGARLSRILDIKLDPEATFLGVESLIFGRAAMGETVEQLTLSDRISVRRGSDLIYADAIRCEGNAHEILSGRAIAKGMIASTTLLYIAPDAQERLENARELLVNCASETGVSAWNGILSVRMIAPSSQMLRDDLGLFLEAFRGTVMPRVWSC